MWKVIGVLLLVGLAIKYWWLVTIVVAVVLTVKYLPAWLQSLDAESERKMAAYRAIAHRADVQHNQVLEGDERGVYGAYTPAC